MRQHFTSKERDAETGLDYFGARYYSSTMGHFTTPDEFTGGPEELDEFDGKIGHNPTFVTTPMQMSNSSEEGQPKPVEGSSGGPGSGKRPSEATKNAVRTRDNNKCVYCGTNTTRSRGPNQSNIDHSNPKSKGGDTTMKNLQNTCRTCNLKKGAKNNKEFLDRR